LEFEDCPFGDNRHGADRMHTIKQCRSCGRNERLALQRRQPRSHARDDLRLVASEIPIMRLWVLPSFDRAKVITLSGTEADMRGLVKVSQGKGGALRGVSQQKPSTITATEAAQIEAILHKLGARTGKVSEEYSRPDGMWLDGTQLVFEFAGPQGYHRFHRHAGDIDTLPGLLELSSIVMKAAGHSPNPADW
jgi:hypothetical protein